MDSRKGSKKKQKRVLTGRAYLAVFYIFLFLFIALIAYMIYFQAEKSKSLLSSQYNRRQDKNAEEIIRGSILARDGTPLAENATDEEGNPYRSYPYANLFAQVVGYSDYGSAGLEASQNYRLLDSHTDIVEQITNNIRNEKSYGDNVITSLDVRMQQAAYDALAGRKGAVIVTQAETGKILASVSQPDFNPNTVYEDWEMLNAEGNESPFLNRSLQGLYEPGSTFKLVTTLAYLREYGTEFYFNCTGEYTQGTYTIHCSDGTAHGEENLTDALANSCNCAYAYMATELLSPDALAKVTADLKFNTDFDLELPSVISSYTMGNLTKDGLSMQTAIGQGDTLMSPLHLNMITQAIYNEGLMLRPSFIEGVSSYSGTYYKTEDVETIGQVMNASEADALKELMRNVVLYGTASALADEPYTLCGKTGTAEFDSPEGYVHSWFTGFTDMGHDDIVITVIIEEAPQGEAQGVAAAKSIIDTYYAGLGISGE